MHLYWYYIMLKSKSVKMISSSVPIIFVGLLRVITVQELNEQILKALPSQKNNII